MENGSMLNWIHEVLIQVGIEFGATELKEQYGIAIVLLGIVLIVLVILGVKSNKFSKVVASLRKKCGTPNRTRNFRILKGNKYEPGIGHTSNQQINNENKNAPNWLVVLGWAILLIALVCVVFFISKLMLIIIEPLIQPEPTEETGSTTEHVWDDTTPTDPPPTDSPEQVYSIDELCPGDKIEFGEYYFTERNEIDTIPWIVLDIDNDDVKPEDNAVLLISMYGLEFKLYNTGDGTASWKDSSINDWLNNKFFNTAFTDEEEACILEVPHSQEGTTDKVFLPSVDEYKIYMFNKEGCHDYMVGQPTPYVQATSDIRNEEYWWWLRTTDPGDLKAKIVKEDGSYDSSSPVNTKCGLVRPMIWLKLSAPIFTK